MPRLRFSVRGLLLLQAVLALAIGSIWWWPKSEPLDISPEFYVGHYRGLGLVDEPGFFGKNYYRFTFPTTSVDETCVVDFKSEGYNPFRETYRDGTLRAEGECLVKLQGFGGNSPAPDPHDVDNATYYKPDGTFGSRVVDGTGTQTYWTSEGRMVWELQLRDHKRTSVKMWDNSTGKLKSRTYDGQGKEVRSP